MHQEVVQSRRDVKRLKERVDNLIEKHVTTVNDDLDSHLIEIMVAKSNEIQILNVEGTFGRVFWDTQFISEKAISNAMGPCDNTLVPISLPPSWK